MKTCHLSLITVSVFLAALIALTANESASAQSPALDPPTAPSEAVPVQDVAPRDKKALISAEAKAAGHGRGDGPVTCSGDAAQLLFPLDGSYSPVNFCALPLTPGFDQAQCTGIPPDQHNDDDSSEIPLDFTFSLFADTYTTVWVNNNGILSFGSFFESFSPLAFPDPSLPALVAPMWQDVDTGQANTVQHGDVWFKQFDSDGSGSDDTLVVTWENVGYFDDHGDLLNTFQVIISDGTNPVMGLGTDLCFSYDNMCWTAGDVSGGVGGLGGTPATVGVNRGNGVDFFQAGRFDHAGVDFDGPFGAADGVSYLDGRLICFAPCDVAGDCDDSNVCTDDACTNGVCEHTPVARGGQIACGDPGDTECDNPDTCDAGVCQSNNEPDGTSCGDPGDTECDNPDTCDGAGACVGNLEPPGTACGDPSDTDCDNPDTCNGAGGCDSNNESPGTSCTDDGEECTDDVCDAGATCTHPAVLDGTVCTDDGNDCTSDNCLAGTCEHPFEPVDTPCGDPGDTDCTDPDTCDGSGVCLDKNVPDDTPCPDDGSPGTEDVCEGGVCVHNDITGACCVGATGLCSDPVFLADCLGPLDVWTPEEICANVPCPRNIPAGEDCYRMECGVQEFSFSDTPIPADFFCPASNPTCGSDPFDGAIRLGGAGTGVPIDDVTLERLDDMDFGDLFPSERTVDIELVSLNLINCDPIEVSMNGGATTALWNVEIGLSSVTPPTGTLTATKENEAGGVFTFSYFVQAKYTFSSVDNPSLIRTYDTGLEGIDPIEVDTLGPESWEHDPGIDGNPCGVGFFPGVGVDALARQAATVCCEDVAGLSVPGCVKCKKGACALDCGTPAVSCTPVEQTDVKKSARKECENAPNSGLGGEYLGDTSDCDDFDCDGIATDLEVKKAPCGTKTNAKKFDSDGDGIGDGDEVVAGTDPNNPCDPPTGTCTLTTPAPCSTALPDCECDDFDGMPVRIACALKDPKNDCGAPTDVAPNFTPDGIPDTCQDADFLGACCTNNACGDVSRTVCINQLGGVFQGYCTRCPTNLPKATHNGVSIVHFSSRPPECNLVPRSAGPEDCSLRTKYYDTWQTDLSGGDQMCHEFGLPGGTPVIPADFFRTGSLAFGGSICLEGEPLGFVSIDVPGGPLIEGEFGDADTMILRSDDPIERCASTSPIGETVDVQVIALNLLSIGSFTVEFDVGPSEEWIAEVSISDTAIANLPLGSLTAVKTHCNGGTYNSVLKVLPKFTFIKVDDPNETRVLDFGDPSPAGFDPVQLTQNNNPPWVHEKFGDVDLANDPCTEFNPGVEGQNVRTVCDCNTNGQRDLCDIETGIRSDCNRNTIPDDCDVDPSDPDGNGLVSVDCNSNGVPDECEDDCNANGIADACDITAGTSEDINLNGTPDECEPDCNGNGVPDGHDLATGTSLDCNGNGVADECELVSGVGNDCNENGAPDSCDLSSGNSQDCNGDGVPDECELETPTLAASPHNIRKNRYISIIPENSGACDVDIRVTLTNTLVTAVDPGQIGSQWWANAPDANCISILGPTRPLTLPSWDACPTLHLTGCPLIPTATYDIVAMVRSTVSDPTLVAETQLLPVDNKWWGDAVGFFTGSEWTGPQGVTNFDDVNACLRTFINPGAVNATHTSVTDVHPNRPDLGGNNVHPNRLVNIDDVFQFIKAFQGFEYPRFDLANCTDP